MKITINKSKFEKHLENISKAVQSSSTLPALKGILIVASESNVILTASTGNLSIREIIEKDGSVNVIEPGSILIEGSLFKNIIKKLSGEITLETNGGTAKIESEGAIANIQLMDHNSYPRLSFEPAGKDLIIDSEALKALISDVAFASADNDKRIILNGVNLKSLNGNITATATNSFRLARKTTEIDSTGEFEVTIITKNLKEFIPVKASGPLTINVGDSKIITRNESTTIESRLIDGVYPAVDGLIPTEFKNVLSLETKLLSSLISKATLVANDGNKVIRLTISSDELLVESKRSEVGTTAIRTSEHNYKGEPLTISVNSQFLKEAISRFTGKIALAMNGAYDPIIIKGPSNRELIQLVLPHRVY